MTSPPPNSRFVVIGGGIFGSSAALHLARLGARVTLVTDGAPASGASGRSLSWLNSARLRSAAYHQLRMAGLERYRALAARHPDAAWLRFDGGLTWDADSDANAIAEVFAHEQNIGYPARHLSADQVAAVTPGVDARAIPPQGAIFNPDEGWVDLPSLIDLLLGEFTALGGRLVRDAGEASVVISGDRVTGVTTVGGQNFPADAILLATGPAVPKIVAKVGWRIPDATPIGLLVRTKPADLRLRAVLNTPRVAVRPALGGTLVLDSGWSEKEVVVNRDGSYDAKASTVQGLLAEASKVLEGNPKLELASCGIGPKPVPEGGEPVFGQLDGVTGYYVAFSHSGATLGLIAGELIAGEMLTGEAHPLFAPFRPDRFAQ
ncbi:NAD(P)/FAD-dependent oxidoreductase [Bosea lathyri]|uniref:Glycine/D-amino acid oxidase n=1 Tax=Bosea lathyri TaxID=1036778 RepID=A0A1H5W911_9HYPH|nr:FAD-binding oxidoreductase [Bosea lathyri]SEF95287.1 Glycine/D-amino acid oxidase [Bosea lathyri]